MNDGINEKYFDEVVYILVITSAPNLPNSGSILVKNL